MKIIRPLVVGLFAATALAATAAQAGVNVGVTLGYPGGYGIAQPAYVAPPPVVVQQTPVYVERGSYGYAYPGWREREREHHNREYRNEREYRGNEWHDHDHDRWHEHDRDGHRDGRDGWRR